MYNEMFANVFEQSQNVLGPMIKANKLAVTNLEKLVAFQMSTLQSYVDLSMNQLKAAAEISSPEQAQAFFNSQLEVAGSVRQKVLDDAKALADLGAGFKAEFDKLAQESVAEFAPRAAKSPARRAA